MQKILILVTVFLFTCFSVDTYWNFQSASIAIGGCGGAGGGSAGGISAGSGGSGSNGSSGSSDAGSSSAAASGSTGNSGTAGSSAGSTGKGEFTPPLGSNDLPGDMDYLPGQSPREQYIRQHEARLENSPADLDALKRLGLVYHHQAVLKLDGMLDKAIESLEKVMQQDPADMEARAFLGSCYTLVARDSNNPFTKMKMVRKGSKAIDASVEKDPKNILIRILRANNSLNLPGFLGRRHFAMEDYLYIEKIAADPDADFGIPSQLGENDSKDVLAQVFYKLGRLYLKEKNPQKAREYFEKSVTAWSESRWARGSKQQLQNL